jgi:hypothetical protein
MINKKFQKYEIQRQRSTHEDNQFSVVICGMPKVINIYHLRRSLATETILLFLVVTQPFLTQAQSKSSKWKNAEDSLVLVHKHLSRWHPYGGIHLSSDAELYHGGPSFQAGLDFNLKPKLAFSTYIHYFHASANLVDNTGLTEKGRFRTFTSAFLVQIHAGSGWYKGFFIGGGVALQQWADRFKGNFGSYDDTRTTVTPAIRMGYIFPAGYVLSLLSLMEPAPIRTAMELMEQLRKYLPRYPSA